MDRTPGPVCFTAVCTQLVLMSAQSIIRNEYCAPLQLQLQLQLLQCPDSNCMHDGCACQLHLTALCISSSCHCPNLQYPNSTWHWWWLCLSEANGNAWTCSAHTKQLHGWWLCLSTAVGNAQTCSTHTALCIDDDFACQMQLVLPKLAVPTQHLGLMTVVLVRSNGPCNKIAVPT